MTDGGIGRLLVASLHQAIGDGLPARLDYYEHWLTPMGLREGRTGLAPLGAVLSFLRQEGQPSYDDIMTRAGRASAEWHHLEAGWSIRVARVLPPGLRARFALGRCRGLIRAAFGPSTVQVRCRRAAGVVDIERSVFCDLRESWPWPTCAYFAAGITRQLELYGVTGQVKVTECRACGSAKCRLQVVFADHRVDGPRVA